MQVILPLTPVLSSERPQVPERKNPRDASEHCEESKSSEWHPRDTGWERDEGSHDRQEAGKEDRCLSMTLEPAVSRSQVLLVYVEDLVAFEQFESPEIPDRVGNPRADQVPDYASRRYSQERQASVAHLEARKQHRRFARDGDAGALQQHQTENPCIADLADDIDTEVDQRVKDYVSHGFRHRRTGQPQVSDRESHPRDAGHGAGARELPRDGGSGD